MSAGFTKGPAVLAEDGYLSTRRRRASRRPRLIRTTLAALALALLTPGLAGATPHAPVTMPNLVGHNRAQVYAVMHRDALYFDTKGPGSARGNWDLVTAQSPRPGTKVAWHAEVHFSVTSAAARAPRRVPRVRGLTRTQVYAAMRRSQLYFRTVGPGSSSVKWTVALASSPAAGTRVPWHGEVTIRVATHRPKKKAPARINIPVADSPTVVNGSNYKVGVATWYNWHAGQCATWYLPKGTTLTVTDLASGKSITCVITDREAAGSNRVVDLSESGFAELAPLSVGVLRVKVSW